MRIAFRRKSTSRLTSVHVRPTKTQRELIFVTIVICYAFMPKMLSAVFTIVGKHTGLSMVKEKEKERQTMAAHQLRTKGVEWKCRVGQFIVSINFEKPGGCLKYFHRFSMMHTMASHCDHYDILMVASEGFCFVSHVSQRLCVNVRCDDSDDMFYNFRNPARKASPCLILFGFLRSSSGNVACIRSDSAWCDIVWLFNTTLW